MIKRAKILKALFSFYLVIYLFIYLALDYSVILISLPLVQIRGKDKAITMFLEEGGVLEVVLLRKWENDLARERNGLPR